MVNRHWLILIHTFYLIQVTELVSNNNNNNNNKRLFHKQVQLPPNENRGGWKQSKMKLYKESLNNLEQ